jgi:hypothetical protein
MIMRKTITVFCTLMILIGIGNVGEAAENTYTCALTRAFGCLPDEGCTPWTTDELALPRLVRIDLESKTITSLDNAVTRSSTIATIDRPEGIVVMHGTEVRGWSISLGEDSGNLTLSASGDGEGFIVFGFCTTR